MKLAASRRYLCSFSRGNPSLTDRVSRNCSVVKIQDLGGGSETGDDAFVLDSLWGCFGCSRWQMMRYGFCGCGTLSASGESLNGGIFGNRLLFATSSMLMSDSIKNFGSGRTGPCVAWPRSNPSVTDRVSCNCSEVKISWN